TFLGVGRRRVMLVPPLGLKAEFEQDWKVVGADWRQSLNSPHGEMLAVKEVVQRPAKKEPPGVKAVEHSAPDAGIEQSADATEAASGAGPGNIVEVTRHHHWPVAPTDLPSHHDQFGIPFQGFVV